MRKREIIDCLRLYRKSVDAFGEVTGKLKAAQAVTVLRQTRQDLKAVEGGMEQIGDGLSVVPELAEQLLLERRICALQRDQAARAGLTFRYEEKTLPEQDGLDAMDDWE